MAAVSRVLPWRRATTPPTLRIAGVLASYRQRWPKASTKLIVQAYEMARQAHEGGRRLTGEEYIQHPIAVASIVAELGLDDISIGAALLHDAVEDTELQLADLNRHFGEDMSVIVDGVTKLARVRFDSKQAQQAATLRKMLVAIARDPRVLAIKLADRLHNMRTVGVFEPPKQESIARETLDIYAPLANRMGMQEMRNELEDLSFAAIYPKRYAEIDRLIAQRTPEQQAYVDLVLTEVRERLTAMKIHASASGRRKHHWSVYEKMVLKGRSFDEIFDLVGIRLVVPTIRDCYAALGSIHATWKPVLGRFKDYVAMPKFNHYQSLHTTVVGPEGIVVEVQIRTAEMNNRAEYGVASHWRYKSKADHRADRRHDLKADLRDADVPWLDRIVDWHTEADDPAEFMSSLATDLGLDEVFVFTPAGDVMSLPTGSSLVDFAYHIHTDIGNSLIGAKINGRLAPLDRQLESGDTVEVFTSKDDGAQPAREWLDFVVTPRARASIRRLFARSDREELVENGRGAIAEAMSGEGLRSTLLFDTQEMVDVANQFGRSDQEMLFEAVGKEDVSAEAVAQRMRSHLSGGQAGQQLPARPAGQRGSGRRHWVAAVQVDGHEETLVHLAQCCQPVHGDEILGFATRGRGISVHRDDCVTAAELATTSTARQVEVDWEAAVSGDFVAQVEVRGLNRNKLLLDVVEVVSAHHLSIVGSESFTGDDQVAVMRFEVELGDLALLEQLLAALRAVPAVFDAYRIVESATPAGSTPPPTGSAPPTGSTSPAQD